MCIRQNYITYTTDIDHCAHDPCAEGHQCVDLLESYECVCATGYTGENCTEGISCTH